LVNDNKKIRENLSIYTVKFTRSDFRECLIKNQSKNYYKEFLEMAVEVEDYFEGVPDIVISDYEPNVAQYAYARNIKLINLEQQSKYLYIEQEMINNISIIEEKSRLKYFFPKSDLHIISSFFPLNCDNNNLVVTSPIINKDLLIKEKGEDVIVYLSPYGDKEYIPLYNKIMNMICQIDNLNFKVYTNLSFNDVKKDNIQVLKFSDDFKENLSKCKFVISTSGHQLISECLYLEKPLLLTSFNTYEQNYNKKMVLDYKLGKELIKFDKDEVLSFGKNVSLYEQNIKKYNEMYKFDDWKETILSKIEELMK